MNICLILEAKYLLLNHKYKFTNLYEFSRGADYVQGGINLANDYFDKNLRDMTLVEKLDLIDNIKNSNCFIENDLNILVCLSHDKDDEIRARVAEVIVFSDSLTAEKILIELLKDKAELVRVNACDSLCNSNSIKVLKLLKETILMDKSSLVKGYAALSIADIATRINYNAEELIEFFKSAVKKEKVNWVKINFYKALYMLGDESYLDILINELNNKFYRNRCAIVNILSEIVTHENLTKIRAALIERLKIEKTFAVSSTIEKVIQYITEQY